MTTSLGELVSSHPFLAGWPDAGALAGLAGCARNVAFSPGELLVAEGEPADSFYLLRRGRVAIETHGPGRPSIVIETVGPGSTVGWSWLVPPYRWQFDARAIDAVGAIALDGACLRSKAEADPAVGYALLSRVTVTLLERLQATRLRLLDLYGSDHGC